MVRGMFLSLAVLLPFGYYTFLALALPLANDVSTNTFNPPRFIKIEELRQQQKAAGINQLAEFDDEYSERLLLAYPKVGPRRYPAGSERVFQAVNLIIADRGWQVVARYGSDESAPASDTEKLAGAKNDAADEDFTPANISVEVTISSPIFGYKYDSVIHIVSEDVTTLVEMRSSSRWGAHDFGVNAKIIMAFMNELDLALLGLAGEG